MRAENMAEEKKGGEIVRRMNEEIVFPNHDGLMLKEMIVAGGGRS